MNPSPPSPFPTDPETRLTAWLLGELSPDEAAALAREVEQDPTLRGLRDRLAATIHFVRTAAAEPAGLAGRDAPPPRLSAARREKLLASFKVLPMSAGATLRRWRLSGREWWLAAAACVLVSLIGAGMLLPALSKAKSKGIALAARNEARQRALERGLEEAEELSRGGGTPPAAGREVTAPEGPREGIYLPGQAGETAAVETRQEPARPSMDTAMMLRYGLLAGPPVSAVPAPAAGAASPPAAPGRAQPPSSAETTAYRISTTASPAGAPIVSFTNRSDAAVRIPNTPETVGSVGVPASFGGVGGAIAPRFTGRANGAESAWGDYDNDSLPDLFVNQHAAEAPSSTLAPLPIQLPIPVFMGTPTDLPLGTRAEAPSRLVSGQPVATVNGRGEAEQRDFKTQDRVVAGRELALKEALSDVLSSRGASSVPALAAATPAPAPVRTEELGLRLAEKQDDKSAIRPAAPPPTPQPEVATAENAFSTFSLNVADVSFKLAAASLEQGQLPDPASIRSEEFINAFEYRDAQPLPGAPLGFHWERARYPFAHNRDVVRFAVRAAALGREANRPLNLVLLLDSSGSMERADRVQILREALGVLAGQLQPADKVSVVAFARTARLWVDGLPGSRANELLARVGELTPEGGTNLEDALRVAYETAARHFDAARANRVVLLTDGAANLGDVNPDSLKLRVESWRQRGIALDCFGIGWEGYNDDLLEVLSRHGDGRYGFLNTPEEAASGFANQLAGALQVAAADVKVQVEFNPHRVTAWRQVGYAKHQLTKEQFRDNTVDAAELGAAEAGNGLYVIEVNPQGQGQLGVVRARFREPTTGRYREVEWTLTYAGSAPPLERASPTLRLAATAAAFAELLANSPYATEVTTGRLLGLLQGVPAQFAPDARPGRLEWMIRQAQSLGLR